MKATVVKLNETIRVKERSETILAEKVRVLAAKTNEQLTNGQIQDPVSKGGPCCHSPCQSYSSDQFLPLINKAVETFQGFSDKLCSYLDFLTNQHNIPNNSSRDIVNESLN